ncbi:DUF4304 domain-containing protein [Cellulomonas fimi]|uniref:DUF4304 domain-containing protein n=1 Tax=Cellulomonas fimi TaxID=1708 RepID=UPI0023581DA3|nr:DUF4304 domain-containing protein [Cellulomonas fimi]
MSRADYDAWRRGRSALDRTDDPAKDVYQRILRDEIGPALRAVGARGSSGRFAMPSATHWAQLTFQKSSWNEADALAFTINLLVIRRDAWASIVARDPWMGKEPSATSHIGPPAAQTRIGFLRPAGTDHWWELTTGAPVEPVLDEVMSDIFCLALPWLDAQTAALGRP